MKLIDAIPVQGAIREWAMNESNQAIAGGALKALQILMSAKRVKPSENGFGHWEMYRTYYRCSSCHCQDAIGLAPYCKNCGSKMDNGVI